MAKSPPVFYSTVKICADFCGIGKEQFLDECENLSIVEVLLSHAKKTHPAPVKPDGGQNANLQPATAGLPRKVPGL